MPIYEYVCVDCRNEFDALRPMSEADAPIRCVNCGGDSTSRKISLFAAHSEGKVIAGGNPSCSTCHDGICSTCEI